MRRNHPDDDQLGRALTGDGPVPPGLESVAQAASRLRSVAEPASAALADRCVAAAAETARLVHDKGDPAAMPASKARRSPWEMSGLPKWSERTMITNTLLSTLAGRIAIGGASAALALGTAASVGALPAPLQSMASEAASGLGVTLPSPRPQVEVEDRDAAEHPEVEPSDAPSEAVGGDDRRADDATVPGADDRRAEPSESAEIRGADEPGEVESEAPDAGEIEVEHAGGDDSGGSVNSGPSDQVSADNRGPGSGDTSGTSGGSGDGTSGSSGSGTSGDGSGTSGGGSGSSGSSGPGSGSVSASPTPSPTSSSGGGHGGVSGSDH